MIKAIGFFKPRGLTISFLVIIAGFLISNCAPTKHKLHNRGTESLKELWLKSYSLTIRIEIVQELENRKAIDALIYLLNYPTIYLQPSNLKYAPTNFQLQDCLVIVQALGRLKDPEAIGSLADATRRLPSKKLKLAVLQAYKEIDNQKAVLPTTELLRDPDTEVRLQALDTLIYFRDPNSMEAVLSILYDKNPDIRWKAIHVLDEIGDPKAMDPISLLLADRDDYVKSLAENVLQRLGASEEKICPMFKDR